MLYGDSFEGLFWAIVIVILYSLVMPVLVVTVVGWATALIRNKERHLYGLAVGFVMGLLATGASAGLTFLYVPQTQNKTTSLLAVGIVVVLVFGVVTMRLADNFAMPPARRRNT